MAEALAEGRGKAHADALRQTRKDLIARRVTEAGEIETVRPAEDISPAYAVERTFGIFGEPRVNALQLNLDLQHAYPAAAPGH